MLTNEQLKAATLLAGNPNNTAYIISVEDKLNINVDTMLEWLRLNEFQEKVDELRHKTVTEKALLRIASALEKKAVV